jgi:hypothetical protein
LASSVEAGFQDGLSVVIACSSFAPCICFFVAWQKAHI